MIAVPAAPEPVDFNDEVRRPGLAFLATNSHPRGNAWRSHSYWANAHDELFAAYNGICSFCASWTKRAANPQTPKDSSVDHFIPKSADPSLAYEWSNYRLCRTRLNLRKDVHQDVLDPLVVIDNAFTIDFMTYQLKPRSTLAPQYQIKVLSTIARLQLNADSDYVYERIAVIEAYCVGNATLSQVESKYPFLAREIVAQDFDIKYLEARKRFFLEHPFAYGSSMM